MEYYKTNYFHLSPLSKSEIKFIF